MARVLALDIGRKRTGIAATDSLKMIASGIGTVASVNLFQFLSEYPYIKEVELFVIGMPRKMNNEPSDAVKYIEPIVNRLKKLYPSVPIEFVDERFTSKIALQTMLAGGLKKKDRQNKALVDTISATIILQSYLEGIDFEKNKIKND